MSSSPNDVQNKGPVHEVRLGAIKGLIWSMDTPNGPKLYATYERLYFDDKEKETKDKWKSTRFYSAAHALTLAKVAELCAIWMFQNPPKHSDDVESER